MGIVHNTTLIMYCIFKLLVMSYARGAGVFTVDFQLRLEQNKIEISYPRSMEISLIWAIGFESLAL